MPCKISVPKRFCPTTNTVVGKFRSLFIVGLLVRYLKSWSNLTSKKNSCLTLKDAIQILSTSYYNPTLSQVKAILLIAPINLFFSHHLDILYLLVTSLAFKFNHFSLFGMQIPSNFGISELLCIMSINFSFLLVILTSPWTCHFFFYMQNYCDNLFLFLISFYHSVQVNVSSIKN